MIAALVQMSMSFTVEGNTDNILQNLCQAKELGADVAVFPESAVSGWTSKILEVLETRSDFDDALTRIRQRCAELQIAAIVGTPYFATPEQDKPWNAFVAIDESGTIQAIGSKVTLGNESRVFEEGDFAPVFSLKGKRCTALLCRDALKREVWPRVPRDLDIVFWPGVMDMGYVMNDEESRTAFSDFTRNFGVFLLQANWSGTADPQQKTIPMGTSLAVSPSGKIFYQCPLNTTGIAIVSTEPHDGNNGRFVEV